MSTPVDPRDALVASPHWEWLPGMANTPEQGGERVVLTGRGLRLAVRYENQHGVSLDQITEVDRPDLDDDATCGCLLALVRKAWGPAVTISHVDGPAVRATTITDMTGAVLFRRSGTEPGERLAAALLAAPPKAGEP